MCAAHITEIHNAWLEHKPYHAVEPERKWDPPMKIKGSGPGDKLREREQAIEQVNTQVFGHYVKTAGGR